MALDNAAVKPPSTTYADPVTKLASSLAKNRATFAISSGDATRPMALVSAP